LDELRNEVDMLKNVQRNQAQVTRSKTHEWEAKREVLMAEKHGRKDEKRKLEYHIYDLLKPNFQNKGKLERIRAICDECDECVRDVM
jgi:hypothetical protein